MSQVRHDAAWWEDDEFNKTLLVVFGDGEVFAEDTSFLPEIAKAIYEFNKNYSNKF